MGRKRVARLMRQAGLRGVSPRRFVQTTRRSERARLAPDLVERDFVVSAPNRLSVADITYLPTGAGFLYLAVVLDERRLPASRPRGHSRVVGARRVPTS